MFRPHSKRYWSRRVNIQHMRKIFDAKNRFSRAADTDSLGLRLSSHSQAPESEKTQNWIIRCITFSLRWNIFFGSIILAFLHEIFHNVWLIPSLAFTLGTHFSSWTFPSENCMKIKFRFRWINHIKFILDRKALFSRHWIFLSLKNFVSIFTNSRSEFTENPFACRETYHVDCSVVNDHYSQNDRSNWWTDRSERLVVPPKWFSHRRPTHLHKGFPFLERVQ